ncbi:MAG: hypothetical protein M0036_09650 [Desulfobacteraceae bacterium]|nr:hypothetical protein [Desulfobacteraceae bacterium]
MKQILTTTFKVFLVLTVLALVVLLVFGLVLWIGWSWWVGFFLLIGIGGLALCFLLFRKIWARRREQMFVHQVIAQDEAMYKNMALKEQDSAKELQARWKEAIEALRKSHLRKMGNPLYVLPWYMVIGESGSGKTTAIQSARLSSPFAQVSRTSGISGTRNCDWWFFEQAILIDTAGRYAVRVDEKRDQEEWQRFLTLLARFRKKEPLNGLVVTVAADRLSQATPETLQEDGRTIRRRIEELTRVVGARPPVYVMVTKCDLIQGATQFCDQLPDAALNQAMGYLNQDLNSNVGVVIDKAMRTVGDRLRDLRLLLLHRTKDRAAASTLLLFPEEIEKLGDGLRAFVNSAFQENPYQETPLLRGIFFSSGRQEGTPFSHFLNALGLIQAREVLRGTNKGLFLHDFFAQILPMDRNLFKPTAHVQEWQKLTRNMGLTAWIAIMVAACGLLSFIFVKNLSSLSDVRKEFQKPTLLQGELLSDILTLDRFRKAVLQVEEVNSKWWMPRLGLEESQKVEIELKRKFGVLFQSGFLKNFDKELTERMTRFDWKTPGPVFGAHVVHLARRINLLKARLAQEDLSQLEGRPQPDYSSTLLSSSGVIPEMQKTVGTEYLYALAWQTDATALNGELSNLQTWLKHLLTLNNISLNWLADYVNDDTSLSAVILSQFWVGETPDDKIRVPAAFTNKGKARIDATIAEIEAALVDPLIIGSQKSDFAQWYEKSYYQSWRNFVLSFDQGINSLQSRDQWQMVARRLPSAQGPYFGLLGRIVEEFGSLEAQSPPPGWVDLAFQYADLQKEARAAAVVDSKDSDLLKKATATVKSKLDKAEKAFGVKARLPMSAEAHINAVKAVSAYQGALDSMVKIADSRNVAFAMATDLYQQDPVTGESPFFVASRNVEVLKAIMSPRPTENDTLFWDLIDANGRFMQRFIVREAACQLQSLWEKQVLLEIADVSADRDMTQLMMGPDGFGTKFIKGSAEPFISRSLNKGFFPKRVMGMEIPLQQEFLNYLSKGAQAAKPTKTSYAVKIRAYPTDTNRGAQIQPHSTVLELRCSDGNTRLENLNYPVAKTFTWSPSTCGDVGFQISVGNLVLTKNYTGNLAFAKFLHEFKTGQRDFRRNEFPSDEAALQRMGIDYIRAKYQFEGQDEVLALLYITPGAPPRKIASCWD